MIKALKHPAVLFSVYMALVGGSYLPYFAFFPIRLSYHVIATALVIWWLWCDGLPSTPLLWPLAATGAVSFVSALSAIDSRIALEAWWHWLINGLIGLMLIQWMRRAYADKLFKTQFAIGGLIALVCLIQWLLSPAARVSGPFGLINLTGAYAAALLVPALVWTFRERRLWLALVSIGLVLVLFMNDSRGAFLSAGVALCMFLVFRYRVHWSVLLVTAAILIALGFGLMSKSASGTGHASGDVFRMDIWRSALEMFKDHPLAGVGPGVFGQAYRIYGTSGADNMSGAHSYYLNILAELGLSGVLTSALLLIVFLRALPRNRTAKQDAILAALIGIGAHLLFDDYPSNNFVFLVNLYAAYLISGKHLKNERSGRAVLEAAAGVSMLFFVLVLSIFDVGQYYYERSLRSGSLSEAQVASYFDPGNRLYLIHIAQLQGNAARVQQIDPTINEHTRMDLYGLINFGRFLW